MTKQDKINIATAENNFKKFYVWLEKAYPAKLPNRVYAHQIGDSLTILHVRQYGQINEETPVAVIPMYPMFDPVFEPEKFYSK